MGRAAGRATRPRSGTLRSTRSLLHARRWDQTRPARDDQLAASLDPHVRERSRPCAGKEPGGTPRSGFGVVGMKTEIISSGQWRRAILALGTGRDEGNGPDPPCADTRQGRPFSKSCWPCFAEPSRRSASPPNRATGSAEWTTRGFPPSGSATARSALTRRQPTTRVNTMKVATPMPPDVDLDAGIIAGSAARDCRRWGSAARPSCRSQPNSDQISQIVTRWGR